MFLGKWNVGKFLNQPDKAGCLLNHSVCMAVWAVCCVWSSYIFQNKQQPSVCHALVTNTHTIHVWYIYLHGWLIFDGKWLIFMVNVGKCTSPMDGMGYGPYGWDVFCCIDWNGWNHGSSADCGGATQQPRHTGCGARATGTGVGTGWRLVGCESLVSGKDVSHQQRIPTLWRNPIASMGLAYLPIHVVDFHGR